MTSERLWALLIIVTAFVICFCALQMRGCSEDDNITIREVSEDPGNVGLRRSQTTNSFKPILGPACAKEPEEKK